jgi:hypothetical protein
MNKAAFFEYAWQTINLQRSCCDALVLCASSFCCANKVCVVCATMHVTNLHARAIRVSRSVYCNRCNAQTYDISWVYQLLTQQILKSQQVQSCSRM